MPDDCEISEIYMRAYCGHEIGKLYPVGDGFNLLNKGGGMLDAHATGPCKHADEPCTSTSMSSG